MQALQKINNKKHQLIFPFTDKHFIGLSISDSGNEKFNDLLKVKIPREKLYAEVLEKALLVS